jgi:hypothetical protein
MARAFSITAAAEVDVAASLQWEKRREFVQRNKRWMLFVLVVTIAGPIVGYFIAGLSGALVGLLLDVLALVLGDRAIIRVREIERGHG